MNAKEKYDAIINEIETMATNSEVSAVDITDKLHREHGMDYRDMNSVFRFMIDTTLLDYVKERKLVASYRHLISGKKLDIQTAYEIAGFDTQQAYNKRFSKRFGMPPTEAFKAKDLSLCTPALTWSELSCNHSILTDEDEENGAMEKESVFGLSLQQYEVVSEVFELSAKYGFEKLFSQFAFEFAEREKVSLKEAFRYTDSLHDFGAGIEYIDPDDPPEVPFDPIEDLEYWGYDPYFIKMFFAWEISVSSAFEIREKLCIPEEEIFSLDKNMVMEYMGFNTAIDFDYYKYAYYYYKAHATNNHGDSDWELFLDYIFLGLPKEVAFERVLGTGDADNTDYYDDSTDLDEEYEAIEVWADQETVWNEEPFDREIDIDNLAYELDELEDMAPGNMEYFDVMRDFDDDYNKQSE